jgi:hypothetical protein
VLEELEAQWKEMSEREIQCSDTQAKQGRLRKANNKVEDFTPARADNNPE